MVNQYPDATATGIEAAAQIVSGQDGVFVTVAKPMLIDLGTVANPLCRFTYLQATAGPPIVAPVISAPVTGGC